MLAQGAACAIRDRSARLDRGQSAVSILPTAQPSVDGDAAHRFQALQTLDAMTTGSVLLEEVLSERPTDGVWENSQIDLHRISVPWHWDRDRRAIFRGGPNGLWLLFELAGELAYTNDRAAARSPDSTEGVPSFARVRAGEILRVVDCSLPDDGLGYDPTIRADFAEVRVSAVNVAVPTLAPRPRSAPYYTVAELLFPRPTAETLLGRTESDLAFWMSIVSAPDDDLPRLLYADWLDERADPAGPVIRGCAPLWLAYAADAGGRWVIQRRRRANWQLAADELKAFADRGDTYFAGGRGYGALALNCFMRRRPQSPEGEWHCLNVVTDSGNPAPPFLNQLLLNTFLARGLAEQRTHRRPASPQRPPHRPDGLRRLPDSASVVTA
ncbi:MAG TPA: TIGR02996 domain-containing protein [Gemmataceae bacterium]|nr:TIGR02996 domain-containing protein [Gemmataceae bacterium]